MPETLIVNRTSLDTQAAIERVHAFQLSQWPLLNAVDGYLGSGTWIACDGRLGLLALHQYRDNPSADAGLQVVAAHLLTPSGNPSDAPPVDTVRTRTLETAGQLGADILSAPYLSMTVRIAEPGHQADLLETLRDILMECAAIEGFTGYRIGVSESLKEELVSLAGWTSQEAFLKSVPTGIVPSVRCYKLAWSTAENREVS